jgi:hypothetical protein
MGLSDFATTGLASNLYKFHEREGAALNFVRSFKVYFIEQFAFAVCRQMVIE